LHQFLAIVAVAVEQPAHQRPGVVDCAKIGFSVQERTRAVVSIQNIADQFALAARRQLRMLVERRTLLFDTGLDHSILGCRLQDQVATTCPAPAFGSDRLFLRQTAVARTGIMLAVLVGPVGYVGQHAASIAHPSRLWQSDRMPPKELPFPHRIQTDPALREIIKLVGYLGITTPITEDDYKRLIEKYGRERLGKASEELVDINAETKLATLKADVRKRCQAILGPAPEDWDEFYRGIENPPRNPYTVAEAKPPKRKRSKRAVKKEIDLVAEAVADAIRDETGMNVEVRTPDPLEVLQQGAESGLPGSSAVVGRIRTTEDCSPTGTSKGTADSARGRTEAADVRRGRLPRLHEGHHAPAEGTARYVPV
jgi:hypothetical protein